ncbi:unnamed protein product, partial [Mesorhabditis spiculigera]
MGEPEEKRARLEVDYLLNQAPEEKRRMIKQIDEIQSHVDNLNEQASEEVIKIEQKYNQLRRPHMEKRTKLLKEFPQFWPMALLNHPQIAALVAEDEEDALMSLAAIEIDEADDIKSGYKITFRWKENEYFENDSMTREYFLGGDEPGCKITQIRWKEGKKLGKSSDRNAPFTFFAWLDTNLEPAADDIAEVIKDDIWPNPLQYYLVPETVEVDDEVEDEEAEDLEEVDDESWTENK